MKDLIFFCRVLFVFFILAQGLELKAEEGYDSEDGRRTKGKREVYFDISHGTFDHEMPHGKPFVLKSHLPESFSRAELHWWLERGGSCDEEPEKISSVVGVLSDDLDVRRERRVKFKVEPLQYSAAYCFSIHGYQVWTDKENKLIESSVLQILKDSQKGKNVLLHRVIKRDLGPLSSYWVDGKGTTLKDYIVEWFEEAGEFARFKRETRQYQKFFNLSMKMVREQVGYFNHYRQVYSGNLGRDYHQLDHGFTPLGHMIEGLPHAFYSDLALKKKDFVKAEKTAAKFFRLVDKQRHKKSCQKRTHDHYCHLLHVLKRSSRRLDQILKELLDSYKKQKHMWSSLETKLEVLAEDIEKRMKDPIFITGDDHVAVDTVQGRMHISFSFGALVAASVHGNSVSEMRNNEFLLFAGVNLYTSAVDTHVPLEIDGGFSRRFSLILGMTVSEIYDARGETRGIALERGMVTGFGYRVTDHFQVGLGALWYRQAAKGAGSSAPRLLKSSPYFSIAMDLDLLKIVFKTAKETSGGPGIPGARGVQ